MSTAIVEYGVGNLFSLRSSLAHLGVESVMASRPEALLGAERIILPGVGAFADAMARLEASGLVPALREAASRGTPLLGICLGMQLLYETSCEYGHHRGLGLLEGPILSLREALRERGLALKTPHMGWNALRLAEAHPLLDGVHAGDSVYFVHSFYAAPDHQALASADYGVEVAAVVRSGSVLGTQFHPEKSGGAGLRILRNFSGLRGPR